MIYSGKDGPAPARQSITPSGTDGHMSLVPVGTAGRTGAAGQPAPLPGGVGYYLPHAPEAGKLASRSAGAMTEALDALADAMVERPAKSGETSLIPPVFTYFGQFIDHDTAVIADRAGHLGECGNSPVVPLPRAQAAAGLVNLRQAPLNLGAVYGDPLALALLFGPLARRLAGALRCPDDPARLRTGKMSDQGTGEVPFPADTQSDLARLGQLLDEPDPPFTEADIRALPEPIRSRLIDGRNDLRPHTALIGDARNDGMLPLSQLHLAFVRFHNRITDEARWHVRNPDDREAVFRWARRMVIWHYQWLILNAYVPMVCGAAVAGSVAESGAPFFGQFQRRMAAVPTRETASAAVPLPLEFSVAAFQFGHSMVRASYDWNRFFGRRVSTMEPIQSRASLAQLFGVADAHGDTPAPGLPTHWGIEWDRLANPVTPQMPDRAARQISAGLAGLPCDLSPLASGSGAAAIPGTGGRRALARRILRLGCRLNLPSGQDCAQAVARMCRIPVPLLSPAHLSDGPTGPVIARSGLAQTTPLWIYVLKEAEIMGRGGRLGPLGGRLVAETLFGMIRHDPGGVLAQTGTGPNGSWHPRDGVTPGGHIVDSLPAFLRAAGVM